MRAFLRDIWQSIVWMHEKRCPECGETSMSAPDTHHNPGCTKVGGDGNMR